MIDKHKEIKLNIDSYAIWEINCCKKNKLGSLNLIRIKLRKLDTSDKIRNDEFGSVKLGFIKGFCRTVAFNLFVFVVHCKISKSLMAQPYLLKQNI